MPTLPSIRSFYMLIIGTGISSFGTGMTGFAIGLWTLKETGSVGQFSLVVFMVMVPSLLMSPVSGTLVDRWPRKLLITAAVMGSAFCSLTIALLYWSELLAVWQVIIIAMLRSVFAGIFGPCMAASTILMVPIDGLRTANSFRALVLGILQLVTPAVGGYLLLELGLTTILIIDLLTFLPIILVLAMIQIPNPLKEPRHSKQPARIRDELAFAWRQLQIRQGILGLMYVAAALAFVLGAVQVLIQPVILGFANEAVLGRILSVSGVGMIFGGIAAMLIKRHLISDLNMIYVGSFLISFIAIIAPIKPNAVWIGVGAFSIMFFFPMVRASSQSLLQRKIDADVQGRVFGMMQLIMGAPIPIAILLSGQLAERFFQGLIVPGGLLTPYLGDLYGIGPDRGIALLMSCFGIFAFFIVLVGLGHPKIRRIEKDLPDVCEAANNE